MRLLSLCLPLVIGLAVAAPASADLVIKGRAAQALHCSAMLFMVSEELHKAGYIKRSERDTAQGAAISMLDYVPGTQDQKVIAMGKRFDKLMRTRTLGQLMDEYYDTSKWCRKNFL